MSHLDAAGLEVFEDLVAVGLVLVAVQARTFISIDLYTYIYIYIHTSMTISLSIYLSIYRSTYLSIYLSICTHLWHLDAASLEVFEDLVAVGLVLVAYTPHPTL